MLVYMHLQICACAFVCKSFDIRDITKLSFEYSRSVFLTPCVLLPKQATQQPLELGFKKASIILDTQPFPQEIPWEIPSVVVLMQGKINNPLVNPLSSASPLVSELHAENFALSVSHPMQVVGVTLPHHVLTSFAEFLQQNKPHLHYSCNQPGRNPDSPGV